MATYLYGLLLADNAARIATPCAGIGGAPLRVLPCGELAALVNSTDAATRTMENVALHDRALAAIVRAGATAAAVRFGQLFESDAACCREVSEHGTRVARILRELDGCVEMRLVLRMDPPDDAAAGAAADAQPQESAGPGRAYLESLRRSAPAVPGISLRDALGPLVRGEKVESLSGGVAMVHLIRREDEGRYREEVSTLPALADATVTGPLPLYSFAEPAS